MRKINRLLVTLFLIVSIYTLHAQNKVTFIPKDKPNVKTDTTFTLLDAKTNYKYYETELADQTLEHGYLLNNKKQGNIQRTFANGIFLSLTQYDNGLRNGIYIECDKSGTILKEENYKNDKLDGDVKIYASFKGVRTVKSFYHYKEGKLHGLQTEFNDMAKPASESNYINGKKHGVSKWYYGNGQLSTEQNYIDDKIEGIYKTYNKEGKVIAQGQYINGKKMGTWLEYNDNGTLKSQGDYKDDAKYGVWKYFDENGNLLNTETF